MKYILILILCVGNLAFADKNIDVENEMFAEKKAKLAKELTDIKLSEEMLEDAFEAFEGLYGDNLIEHMKQSLRDEWFKYKIMELFYKAYSEEELSYLVDFYNTPIGKDILRKETKLTQLIQVETIEQIQNVINRAIKQK